MSGSRILFWLLRGLILNEESSWKIWLYPSPGSWPKQLWMGFDESCGKCWRCFLKGKRLFGWLCSECWPLWTCCCGTCRCLASTWGLRHPSLRQAIGALLPWWLRAQGRGPPGGSVLLPWWCHCDTILKSFYKLGGKKPYTLRRMVSLPCWVFGNIWVHFRTPGAPKSLELFWIWISDLLVWITA